MKIINNLKGENMKTYTIQFKIGKTDNEIQTNDQSVVEDFVMKYWNKEIDLLTVLNNSENLKMDYDNTPAVARKERA
tara:strand:- start:311 stop:541 length:231 start_codon:yes stop_codon:yes gene_type:complete